MVVSYIQSKGGYSSGAEQYTTDVHTHTQNQNETPETICEVITMLSNLEYQHTAYGCTPKSSGGHLGIYIPLWMAYALQLGSCSAAPLLCGG